MAQDSSTLPRRLIADRHRVRNSRCLWTTTVSEAVGLRTLGKETGVPRDQLV